MARTAHQLSTGVPTHRGVRSLGNFMCSPMFYMYKCTCGVCILYTSLVFNYPYVPEDEALLMRMCVAQCTFSFHHTCTIYVYTLHAFIHVHVHIHVRNVSYSVQVHVHYTCKNLCPM